MNANRAGRDAAMVVILPLMVLSAILNQQAGSQSLLWLGQLASTLGTICAMLILCATFPSRWWAWLIAIMVVVLRLARIALPEFSPFLHLYEGASGALYCSVGIIAAIEKPTLIVRQLWWTCVAGLPLMVLQVLGVGEWTQTLRMDLHDGGYGIRTQYPTLFQRPGDVVLNVIQSRPAGLFPSNNLLSFIVMLTLGWQFGRRERQGQFARDALLVAVAVLTMAKSVFLTMALIFLWLFFVGGRASRRRILKAAAVAGVMGWAYALLFPGLFAYNTDWDKVVLNFKLRWNDLLYATGNPALMQEAEAEVMTLPTTFEIYDESQRQSGYANLARNWPTLAIAAVLLAPIYVSGLFFLRKHSRPTLIIATTVAIATTVVPMITSFLGAVLLWYVAGAAILPLVVAVIPSYRRLFVRALMAAA